MMELVKLLSEDVQSFELEAPNKKDVYKRPLRATSHWQDFQKCLTPHHKLTGQIMAPRCTINQMRPSHTTTAADSGRPLHGL